MNIFVTGANGWLGSAIVDDLLSQGYGVSGLVRSKDKAEILKNKGASAVIGSLDNHEVLIQAASNADAVIHTAFHHDFTRFAESAAQDAQAINWMGKALTGSNKPFLVTSGLSGLPRGALESDKPLDNTVRRSEFAASALLSQGVNVGVIRLACSVHGEGDHAFVPRLIQIARESGVSAWAGEGRNEWSGVHRSDAARLYRMVLEAGLPLRVYHATADEVIPFRLLAEEIARGLSLTAESRPETHFGGFAKMVSADMSASSSLTRRMTGWAPTGPTLFEDIINAGYLD